MDSIIFSYIWLLIIIFGIFGFFIYLYSQKKEKESILKSFEMTLFLVTLPKYELKKEEKEAKQDKKKSLIALMEQVYTNFLYFDKKRKKILISLEIASEIGGSDISFYVAVPKEKETGFEKYITAVYPRAVVEKIPQDYTIFEPECLTAGSFLKVENGLFLPIATYKNLEEDPLASLTNALSKISVDEGAAIQVIIRPASTIWRKRVNSVLSKVREGKSLSQAISETYGGLGTKFLKEIPKSLSSQQLIKSEKKTDVSEKESKRTNERLLKAIESKVEKEFFEVNIRLVSSAKTQERAEEIEQNPEKEKIEFKEKPHELVEKLYREKKEALEKRELLTEEEKIIRKKLKEEIEKIELSPDLSKQAERKAKEIEHYERRGKLKRLLDLAQERGISFATKVAKNMKDPYTLDIFHDILAMNNFYKHFKK